MKATPILLLVVLAAIPGAAQQPPRPMTFEDMLRVRQLSQAQLSPNGQHVAYVVETHDLATNSVDTDVWLAPADGSAPRRLTTNAKKDRAPQWSPDGARLAFISERAGAPQVFVMSPFGGEAEQATTLKAGAISFAWSPDGGRLAVVAPQASTEDEEKKTKGGDDAITVDLNLKHTRLWLVTVATRDAKETIARDWDVLDPQWSPDGAQIAFQVLPSQRADDRQHSDIWVLDVSSGGLRKLTDSPGADDAPRWAPDGRLLAYRAVSAGAPIIAQPRLVVIAATRGAPRAVTEPSFSFHPASPPGRATGPRSISRRKREPPRRCSPFQPPVVRRGKLPTTRGHLEGSLALKG